MNYINKTRFFALFLTLTLLFTLALSYAKTTGRDISNAVVRLHIVANSNSERDQKLKLNVRDRIIKDTSHIFEETLSPTQALALASENISLIKNLAKNEIKRLGYDYPVTVSVGKEAFPTKTYGNLTLPSGRYNAVKVKIGEAEGENWWCVMYPPLCFTDGIISVSENSISQLKNSLSESEFMLLTKSSTSLPVEIKFKIVELFQSWF
ncbi:MAG: stage II sporulation protein R [Clostridia bacterium]|nr:stage II sporulation protein R [Clostridia bacterium]